MGQDGSNVQDAIAHGFRLGLGQCAVEADHLAPGERCTRDQAAGHPGLVAHEALEGQVGQPAVLPGSDPVFDPGVSPVTQLECAHVPAVGVGDERGVAELLRGVEQGQSFGFEGSLTAKDRLRSHQTLQGIHAEALARSPDTDVWLLLISFEDPYILTEIDPTVPTLRSDEEDNEHIDKVMETQISLQQQVNLTEAMLIRYFDPPYNIMFRNSFPIPAHRTYRECYDLDFHSVGVELGTEEINCMLWSQSREASWLHIPHFPLHSDENRASMFNLFE